MTATAPMAERIFDESALNALPDGLAVLRDGIIIQTNLALAALMNCPVDVLTGREFQSLIASDDPDTLLMRHHLHELGGQSMRVRLQRAGLPPLSVALTLRREMDAPMPGDAALTLVSVRDVSSSTEIERRLRDAEQQYRSIFENAQEGIYQTTENGTYINVNPALARIYGYEHPGHLIDELTDIAGQLYVDPNDRETFKSLMAAKGVVRDFEARIRRRDGEVIWITENARCVRDLNGGIRYYEGTVEDITDRKQAEENIRLLAKAFESVAEGIVLLDVHGIVRAVNPAFSAITDFTIDELQGGPLRLVAEGLHEKNFFEGALQQVRETGHWQGEIFCERNHADPFPGDCTISVVRDPDGRMTHFVLTLQDISRRKQDEEYIRFHANFDTLTRLPNRRLVMDRLEQALLRCQRTGGRGAILFLDLDRFKQINDTFGHAAGDQLLRLVARRLKHCVRLSDTVGRIGGDEFVILLPDCGPGNIGSYIAEKVLYSLSEPFTLMDSEQFCIPSIGIAYFPDQGTTVEDLLRHADMAMYHAKQGGERRYCVFEPSMTEHLNNQLGIETDLRLALARDELELHYQPKVSSGTLSLLGAEALLRWRHPVHGMISPARFIPLAEETGLILAIGRWVLRKACTDLLAWRELGLDLPSVSVNVSARQFSDSTFVPTVRQVLEQTGIEPHRLDLEITESVMTGDVERAVQILLQLKDMGVTLSMDDFGTGYSSLNYIKTFPIDTLKIDQTFVRDVTGSPKDAAIAATIITLAMNLNFSVVAEGVETAEQADFLRSRGCDVFQGYWISRPLPGEAFADFVRKSPPRT
ncbi:sensor domain-containing protein [Insolitispirillum peregrinum]|uniref:sensor domain-containing protein n=1 Tax=Insolitispirillum peregrinum TaxID=80876 RepID=UPI00360C56E2